MSGKMMGQVWDLKLPHNKLIVLLAMADHADHDGNNIYPSMGLIAYKTGYSERQVQRIVKHLVADGLLVLEKSGHGKTNTYKLDTSKGEKKEPYTPDKMSPPSDVTPDKMSQGGVTQLCQGGGDIQMSPEPSLNQKEKDSDEKIIAMPQAAMDEPKAEQTISHGQVVEKEKIPAEYLADAMGITIAGNDWNLFKKQAKLLIKAGIEPPEFGQYVKWVQKLSKTTGGWKVTVTSLTSNGRMSEYRTKRDAYAARQAEPIKVPDEFEDMAYITKLLKGA